MRSFFLHPNMRVPKEPSNRTALTNRSRNIFRVQPHTSIRNATQPSAMEYEDGKQ